MKKLAILAMGMASACLLPTAHAQSSVTLYGVIDNGIDYQSPNGAKATVRAVSGGLFASRFGLKGTEDIGGGLHVNFQLEDGFNGETGAAASATAAFNRQAWVGLSGHFGEVRLGLQNTPQYIFLNPELDPLAVQSIGSPMNSLNSLTVRETNAISYFTPTYYGLSAQFMVAMRDTTTKPSQGLQFYNAAVKYINGPFHIAAGYEQAGNATGTSLLKIFNAGTSMSFGAARVFLAYHNERQTDNSIKRDTYQLSGSYMLNPANMVVAMYAYEHDRTGQGNNAQQVGLTYEYLLSTRTTLYGAAGFIQNRSKAAFTLTGTNYAGVAVSPGANTRGVTLGIVHRF
ncbi:porin [Robbsia sp. KACC 23696]|uniref:porin n=1 Tax=Robbsia sp. KACC 23696 TaxID=3149231 RepID=UPI00325B167C